MAFEVASELLDRYMIHARSTAVASHFAVAGEQIALRPHLFNQAEPYVSFHALFERGQHAVGPHLTFGPGPAVPDVSALFSQRHCRRLCFVWCVHSASIFLRPFAPPALPGFNATTDALTSASLPCRKRISLFHVRNLPTVPPPTTRDRPRSLVCFLSRAYRVSQPFVIESTPVPVGRIVIWASPLPSRLAAVTSRIEFVILRTSRSPPVAPHPASRRRSYLRLREAKPPLDGDLHPADS